MGKSPHVAVGMGAHVRRKTGDQYDFFNVDYQFDDGVHMQSTIRQLNGCANGTRRDLRRHEGHGQPRGHHLDLVGEAGLEVRRPA